MLSAFASCELWSHTWKFCFAFFQSSCLGVHHTTSLQIWYGYGCYYWFLRTFYYSSWMQCNPPKSCGKFLTVIFLGLYCLCFVQQYNHFNWLLFMELAFTTMTHIPLYARYLDQAFLALADFKEWTRCISEP